MLNYPAAYQSTQGSALDPDRAFYGKLASRHGTRELVDSFIVPIRSGRAWECERRASNADGADFEGQRDFWGAGGGPCRASRVGGDAVVSEPLVSFCL